MKKVSDLKNRLLEGSYLSKLITILIVLIISISMIACASGEKKSEDKEAEPNVQRREAKVVVMAHVNSLESSWEKGLQEMASIINEGSNGGFNAVVFGNGVLSQKNPMIMIEQIQQGSIHIAIESVTSLVSVVPELFAINMPFMFSGPENLAKFLEANPPILQQWKGKFEDINMVALRIIPRDFRQLSNSSKFIKSPDDIKGLRYRVPNNPWWVKTFEAFGARPTPIASSEIYSAIQLGTVVGEDNSIPVVYDWKFYEVAPYMTIWNYMADGAVIVASKDFWDSLSNEEQDLIMEAVIAGGNKVIDLDKTYAQIARNRMEEAGVKFYEMTEAEKEPFREMVKPIYNEFAKQIGQDNWDAFVSAVEQFR